MTGVAWLSSARVVRCWVKSSNERNPRPMLYIRRILPGFNQEEGGDDVKSAWLLQPGLHTCYNGVQQRDAKSQDGANPIKSPLSSDRGLQLALSKLESLVTVNQPRHGEYVLGFCTHRPSHHGSE